MRRLFDALAAAVIRRPVAVVVAALLVTGVLGSFNGQMVNEDGVAVDNEVAEALDVVGTSSATDSPCPDRRRVHRRPRRPLGRRPPGDDRAAIHAILDSAVADTLAERSGQPPVVSYLDGAEQAVEQQGIALADLDDADVLELQPQTLEQLPGDVAARTEALTGRGDPPSVGLLLVFQDSQGLDEDAVTERQRALADVVDGAELPDGMSADAFSFGLLLTGTDIGPEVGRLFGTALLIILVVLAFVYWVRPEQSPAGASPGGPPPTSP
jgi:uncharacterized protein